MHPRRKSESGQPTTSRVSLMKLSKWMHYAGQSCVCPFRSRPWHTLRHIWCVNSKYQDEHELFQKQWWLYEVWLKKAWTYVRPTPCYLMLFVYLGCVPYRYCKSSINVPGSELCWPVRKPLAVALVLKCSKGFEQLTLPTIQHDAH